MIVTFNIVMFIITALSMDHTFYKKYKICIDAFLIKSTKNAK